MYKILIIEDVPVMFDMKENVLSYVNSQFESQAIKNTLKDIHEGTDSMI